MPITNFSDLQFSSALAGLENYENDSFNFNVTGHNLAAGGVSQWTTSWPITNTTAISTVILQYTLDNIWRYTSGVINLKYAADTYSVETLTYYANSNLNVQTYVVNLTGGLLAIPAFSVNIRVALFNAPF